MEIFNYSGPDFDIYGDQQSDPLVLDDGPWPAPVATEPLDVEVEVPGSKSITNRELVLSALANAPSTLRHPLHARDTQLMSEAVRQLGATVDEEDGGGRYGPNWVITPAEELEGGVTIDCGLAGNVMRFVPPMASLALGPVTFDGDKAAQKRPMSGTIQALRDLGVDVNDDGRGRLPFSMYGTGAVEGGELEIDASASSQFVSGLLLSAPRFEKGLTLRHTGSSVPSLPHIEMTLESLRNRGVDARMIDERTWGVEPGPISGIDMTIEPDLSNAAPFMLATVVAGGEVRIPNWPDETTQVGDLLREILPKFGAQVSVAADGLLTCRVERGIIQGGSFEGFTMDFADAGGELVPNIAAVCAFASSESRLTGIGHLRGHETDRVKALATELTAVGSDVDELDEALVIRPAQLHGAEWKCYADHRMATSGALVGLAVEGIALDDVQSTSKTLPQFVELWEGMLAGDTSAPVEVDAPTNGFLTTEL
ncbi:3-phosphoshikimate 1-carboxyvinyltransferase [Gulosibacter molinativorax]|uniref:3-phosphoshikimate 1-carboxyvinyltransferase n=1 Tax=Gulosibacter molinativorax TaxID=256821 RepID=A0ABT7C3U5_9MICO|nr:3-phosphoshikimate 1-carboxyvinyltransferase [Gulosibacter molinativorax]MDJ1369917.1 3-phosphoshikimate 1-carboxyvinyltransferase [Gulosibacter molinativorax]QUY61886.1 3-phosphoshikimate 1-carboxyvinyltransferase [Gulosibacter molinativorax]